MQAQLQDHFEGVEAQLEDTKIRAEDLRETARVFCIYKHNAVGHVGYLHT